MYGRLYGLNVDAGWLQRVFGVCYRTIKITVCILLHTRGCVFVFRCVSVWILFLNLIFMEISLVAAAAAAAATNIIAHREHM